jgi:hypothetical protein
VKQTVVIEIVQAFVACVLIAIEAYLLVAGKPSDGFTEAVPIVLAFYFGRQAGNGIAYLSSQSYPIIPPAYSGDPKAE